MAKWFDKLKPKHSRKKYNLLSYLQYISAGSFYRISDMRSESCYTTIKNKIDVMRALADDSQVSTALSYYATDATTPNNSGQIIWATSESKEIADLINQLFKNWNITAYARDHILELATVGNLYIPTTLLYKDEGDNITKHGVILDNNTIPDDDFNIIPSTKIQPDTILHLWDKGIPSGYILQTESTDWSADNILNLPEDAVIHFSLGGLLGEYKLSCKTASGDINEYDVQFAEPLMSKALQPTQTLSLLEDAVVLSSLSKVIRFINVECGSDNIDETEVEAALQKVKNAIEQNLAINTDTGDTQSYVNPQSPNNLIYLPKIQGQDAISITDLDMQTNEENDSKLLQYYMDKKLSVLGIPKEALNFSSNEGLGGAGAVMSQRSALYANSLSRLMTAYISGWTNALNTYFENKNMIGFIDKFELHMNPILTQQSTIEFDRRDSVLAQASTFVQLFKDSGITDNRELVQGLSEILSEVFPKLGSSAVNWDANIESENGGF